MNLSSCDRLTTLPVPPLVLVLLQITSINVLQRQSVKETKANVDKCYLVIWSYCLALLNLAVLILYPVKVVTETLVHRHLLTYPEQTWLLPITNTKKL